MNDTVEAARCGNHKFQRDVMAFFSGLGSCLLGHPGGAGIAVEQDTATLRFRVTRIAPTCATEANGRIRVGDFVAAVDGRPCADAAGLNPAQAAEVRRLCAAGAAGDDDSDWLIAALGGGKYRAIADIQQLRQVLAGPQGSWVVLKVRGGGRTQEVRLAPAAAAAAPRASRRLPTARPFLWVGHGIHAAHEGTGAWR